MQVSKGAALPLGATLQEDGINFSVYSEMKGHLQLVLFRLNQEKNLAEEFGKFTFDPEIHKTGHVWHMKVSGIPEKTLWAYRIDQGSLLIDPYSKGLMSSNRWNQPHSLVPSDHPFYCPLSELPENYPFDWEDDKPPHLPMHELIIYEMHIRGMTQDSSSKVNSPGTFLGLIEKIPHFLNLGINAVEFLPIFEFNELEYANCYIKTKERLCNFWGYSTVNFFSPMLRFATSSDPQKAIHEFKTLVKALHQAKIEVILDVVYNHTSEGGDPDHIQSFKGLAPKTYYMTSKQGEFLNFTGCGNTVNANHPVVNDFIIDSLRYWVLEMHVDGFRFDLTSALTRDERGIPLSHPPIIKRIAKDPILSETKLIGEAWDAAGLYQVGHLPNHSGRWAEWNGPYRDDVRKFIKGTPGAKNNFSTRLGGSSDLYMHWRRPYHSINFITAHDGFSLHDLVSYNSKHNETNGEGNRDGMNENLSWNCGIEGPTEDQKILSLRNRQMINHHLALMVSQGTPMIYMGDEYGHTKEGNNNTWCHDSPLNYFVWDELERKKEFFEIYRNLIHFRKKHPILRRETFLTDNDILWLGSDGKKIQWFNDTPFLAFILKDQWHEQPLYVAFNATNHKVNVTLPEPPKGKHWHEIINTGMNPIVFSDEGLLVSKQILAMESYSSLIFKAL